MKKTRADRENSELLKIVGGIVVIVTLYFARVVFIPLALAWLFSLLLIPLLASSKESNCLAFWQSFS